MGLGEPALAEEARDRAEAAWAKGRLDARAGPSELLFGRMFEDAAIELCAFRPGGLSLLRAGGPIVGWTARRMHEFLDLEKPKHQVVFWRRHLDTARFRAAIDALLSRATLSRIYAPALLHGLPPGFGPVIRGRMERCFARHSNRTNPYAAVFLLGDTAERPGAAGGRGGRVLHEETAPVIGG